MDGSEEANMEGTILQLMEFLGSIYVRLQEVQAMEEYTCEQYEASKRFVRRCSSGLSLANMPNSEVSLHKNPGKAMGKSGSASVEQHRKISGPDDSQNAELVALCDFIDTVLLDAKRVRGSSGQAYATMDDQIQKVTSTSKYLGPHVVPDSLEGRCSIGLAKATNQTSNIPKCKPGEKRNKPTAKRQVLPPLKDKNLKECVLGVGRPRTNIKVQGMEGSLASYCEDRATARIPLSTRARPNPTPTTRKEVTAQQSTPNEQYRPHFPEKYKSLLSWLKVREGYWFNKIAHFKKRVVIEETFVTLLHDMSIHQDIDDKEWKYGTSHIRDLQVVMEDLRSHVSSFEMDCLDRLAPGGSKVAEVRNFCIQRLLPSDSDDYTRPTTCEEDNAVRANVQNLLWVPSGSWGNLCQNFFASKNGNELELDLEQGPIRYFEPEHLLLIARLSHCVQSTLFHSYLEEVFATPLLQNTLGNTGEQTLTDLLRFQLTHSILCKEGRNLIVLAERITSTT